MTTPPPRDGEYPDDGPLDYPRSPDEPSSGYPPPPACPPPPGSAYHGAPPPPGYPYQQWRPPPPASRIAIGTVFAGCAAWAVINVLVALGAILVSAGATSGSDNLILGAAALGLVLIAFGVGGGLLAVRNRYAKGFGLGLMIGWALTSLFTVGFCTGINPAMYQLPGMYTL